MKFKTRIWKRTANSFAVTVPNVALVHVDVDAKNKVLWEYNKKSKKWTFQIHSQSIKRKSPSQIITSLWKRSQRSFATTIPQVVLLHIDVKKKYDVVWDFDLNNDVWIIEITRGDSNE